MSYDVKARIQYLLSLEDGWLDGSGKAISKEDIGALEAVLTRVPTLLEKECAIFPEEDGGVLFTYVITKENDIWDYEFSITRDRFDFFGAPRKGNKDSAEFVFFLIKRDGTSEESDPLERLVSHIHESFSGSL